MRSTAPLRRLRGWFRSRAQLLCDLNGSLSRIEILQRRLTVANDDLALLEEKLASRGSSHAEPAKVVEKVIEVVFAASDPVWGPAASRDDVLRERARADALAERVDLLQQANMGAGTQQGMTTLQALAVNHVLGHVLGLSLVAGITAETARMAARDLACDAHATLRRGLSGELVAEQWPGSRGAMGAAAEPADDTAPMYAHAGIPLNPPSPAGGSDPQDTHPGISAMAEPYAFVDPEGDSLVIKPSGRYGGSVLLGPAAVCVYVPRAELPWVVAALYRAAGQRPPIILDRPADDQVQRWVKDGMVAVLGAGMHVQPDDARERAAQMAAAADLAERVATGGGEALC
ncbi:hypothetical protein [Sphaerisporangium aureirubrum]|uniref:Uncharacterized protein n=1 Tax=Sphaerisporangium aureirubrum TaxID=1544736 RepID=A0ABW1NDH5_9ACTN